MHRIIEYTALFLVVVLLQFFLFSNLSLGVYINPLIYVAFLVLLPMQLSAFAVLMLGFMLGVVMDFMMGTFGINTVACLFVAFSRPLMLRINIGSDEIKDGGIPCVRRLGALKFIRYAALFIIVHSLIYFSLETATTAYYYLTLLRVAISSVISLGLIYACQFFFTLKEHKS